VFFFVLEWFGTSFQQFFFPLMVPNKIPSFFLFCGLEQNFKHCYFIFFGMVRNENPKFLLHVIFFLRNGLEQNSEHLLLNGLDEIIKFRVFLSSAKWFGTEFQAFFIFCWMACNGIRAFSVPQNRRNSDKMNQNFRLFRVPLNIFLSRKIATPRTVASVGDTVCIRI
jgi:hypothetical protein